MSDLARSTRLLAVASWLVATWLMATCSLAAPTSSGPSGGPDCLVARVGTGDGAVEIRSDDVATLRAQLEPAPSAAAASRLALDAALAHRLEVGPVAGPVSTPALTDSSPIDWLASYRRLVAESWAESGAADGPEALRRRLAEARTRFGVVIGPCRTESSVESRSDLGED